MESKTKWPRIIYTLHSKSERLEQSFIVPQLWTILAGASDPLPVPRHRAVPALYWDPFQIQQKILCTGTGTFRNCYVVCEILKSLLIFGFIVRVQGSPCVLHYSSTRLPSRLISMSPHIFQALIFAVWFLFVSFYHTLINQSLCKVVISLCFQLPTFFTFAGLHCFFFAFPHICRHSSVHHERFLLVA